MPSVHMNGRIYDPLLGRFLSADILVSNPHDLQTFNRYSYCSNKPLSTTDPSGFESQEESDQKRRVEGYFYGGAAPSHDYGKDSNSASDAATSGGDQAQNGGTPRNVSATNGNSVTTGNDSTVAAATPTPQSGPAVAEATSTSDVHNARDLFDYAGGIVTAAYQDINPFAPDFVPSSAANASGMASGHGLTFVASMNAMADGTALVGVSGFFEFVTGGSGTPVCAPAAVGGVALAGAGAYVGTRSLRNFGRMEMRGAPNSTSTKISNQIQKKGLPTSGQTPYKAKYRVNKAGNLELQRGAPKYGPKVNEVGFVDENGRIWIKEGAHAGYPEHWDVQVDEGRNYFRVGLDGNPVVQTK